MLRPAFFLIILSLAATVWGQETELPFEVSPVATFNEPWAMTFLPDGRLLVTEKRGRLYVVTQEGDKSRPVEEVPNVDYRGQGGLGDVILHPDFENNGQIYLSYAEEGVGNTRGAAVARARLVLLKGNNRLEDVEVIWRQNPKMTDDGHYGHRMAFDSEGHLFITSGDRQKFEPAQHMTGTVGKIVRLQDDGTFSEDYAFYDMADVTALIWSLWHRKPLGFTFDDEGLLCISEMGRLHGYEFFLVLIGKYYC